MLMVLQYPTNFDQIGVAAIVHSERHNFAFVRLPTVYLDTLVKWILQYNILDGFKGKPTVGKPAREKLHEKNFTCFWKQNKVCELRRSRLSSV